MFNSFVMAGFDCTHGRNVHRAIIDSRLATQHAARVDEDYRMLAATGIRAVRDGAPWPEIQVGRDSFDWTPLDTIVEAADRHDIDVLHDFCHFGVPEHVDLFSADFPGQFAEFCYLATRRIRSRSDRPVFVNPINEPSYFAWAAAHAALFPPYCRDRAFELKVQLAKAILAGIDAIWTADPRAGIVNVDPICRVVAPVDRPELAQEVDRFNRIAVFESLDLIAGRLLPELGGSARHLGTIGINYYWTNQWEIGREDVPLAPGDPRAVSLAVLVDQVWKRYGAVMIISETGHVGDSRAGWARELAGEVATILARGIPLRGACLYPIIGMPSWHDPETWLHMGLWDVVGDERVLHQPMLEALAGLLEIDIAIAEGGFDGRRDRATGRI